MRILITQGEPSGVGPDLVAKLAQLVWSVPLTVIGNEEVLLLRAKQCGLPLRLIPYTKKNAPLSPGEIYFLSVPLSVPVQAGVLNVKNASHVIEQLAYAGRQCLLGHFDAIVTAPVHKGIINEAGILFSGHTEFFAKLASVSRVVMMLMNKKLKVALVTTHLPLRAVPDAITYDVLKETIMVLYHDLVTRFKLPKPRVAICGLNPHAGEGGYLGNEEIGVIKPVLEELQKKDIDVIGPFPADTIFLEKADVILAMYHDQALPMVKFSDFHHTVNVTLGLPFVRTSPDHGTALNLAGTGRVDPRSMIEAIRWAIKLARKPA